MSRAVGFMVRGVVTTIVILCMGALGDGSRVEAQSSSCSADSGAFFCGNFETGTLSGWAPNGSGAVNINVASPGLVGTNYKARFYNSLTSGDAEMDKGLNNKLIPNGGTFWTEFWIEYEPGFQWQLGCSTNVGDPSICLTSSPTWINASFKTYDFRANGSSCQERLLLTVWGFGTDSPAYSRGHPQFSIYPNYCAGGTGDPSNTSDKGTEAFAPSFTFEAGHAPYHVIWEITSATGTAGSYRVWVDGNLIIGKSGLQTCAESGGCQWSAVFLGGPQANAGSGQYFSYDEIRFTTTNIAPTAGSLGTPTGLTVR